MRTAVTSWSSKIGQIGDYEMNGQVSSVNTPEKYQKPGVNLRTSTLLPPLDDHLDLAVMSPCYQVNLDLQDHGALDHTSMSPSPYNH